MTCLEVGENLLPLLTWNSALFLHLNYCYVERERERLLALGIGIPMYVMEMAKFSQQGQTRLKRESKHDGKNHSGTEANKKI